MNDILKFIGFIVAILAALLLLGVLVSWKIALVLFALSALLFVTSPIWLGH